MILAGTLALWVSSLFSNPLSLIDALFTSTSAVCVTGLIVVDTGSDLSMLSQFIVLFLIQAGGLGAITAASALMMVWGSRIGIRQRMMVHGGFGVDTPSGAVRLLMWVVKFTFVIEIAGAVPLFFGFLGTHEPLEALYMAVFHSISAFCNAGFSPLGRNLADYSLTWLVPGTVMLLIVIGGLGFIPLSEIVSKLKGEYNGRFSIHSRLVLTVTIWLVVMGAVFLGLFEWNGVLGGIPGVFKVWNALFLSITPRTAGFNTVDTAGLTSAGILLTSLLMLIGGSPGSTAGGLKTTTLGILYSTTANELGGGGEVVLWSRRLPLKSLKRALALLVVYLGTIFAATLILMATEHFEMRDIIFEVISALGTVGLSTGITPQLSGLGKLVLVLLMFWGRVGIITFMYSLVDQATTAKVSYTDISIPIG